MRNSGFVKEPKQFVAVAYIVRSGYACHPDCYQAMGASADSNLPLVEIQRSSWPRGKKCHFCKRGNKVPGVSRVNGRWEWKD